MTGANVDGQPALIYIHVPKAAGTTFNEIIERNYPAEEIATILHQPGRSIEDFKCLPLEQRERLRIVKGHFPFGVHEYLPQPSTYVTILRDPIERILSHYYYVLRTPEHYLYDRVAGSKMTLEEYISNPVTIELDNGQVRLISGCGRFVPIGECGKEHLQRAKDNLEKSFLLAGLAERFDETLVLLQDLLGWKRLFYTRKNVSEQRYSTTPEIAELVRDMNRLDVELYDFVSRRFGEFIAQGYKPEEFSRKLEAFRRANASP
jgi:hypothetical protein